MIQNDATQACQEESAPLEEEQPTEVTNFDVFLAQCERHEERIKACVRRRYPQMHESEIHACYLNTCFAAFRALMTSDEPLISLFSYLVSSALRRAEKEREANTKNDGVSFDNQGELVLPSPQKDALDTLIDLEQSDLLQRAIERLSQRYPKQAEVIKLRLDLELSLSEIAVRLDIPDGTAKSRYAHGVRNLQEILLNMGYDPD